MSKRSAALQCVQPTLPLAVRLRYRTLPSTSSLVVPDFDDGAIHGFFTFCFYACAAPWTAPAAHVAIHGQLPQPCLACAVGDHTLTSPATRHCTTDVVVYLFHFFLGLLFDRPFLKTCLVPPGTPP